MSVFGAGVKYTPGITSFSRTRESGVAGGGSLRGGVIVRVVSN